jgi:hypothetical protein
MVKIYTKRWKMVFFSKTNVMVKLFWVNNTNFSKTILRKCCKNHNIGPSLKYILKLFFSILCTTLGLKNRRQRRKRTFKMFSMFALLDARPANGPKKVSQNSPQLTNNLRSQEITNVANACPLPGSLSPWGQFYKATFGPIHHT